MRKTVGTDHIGMLLGSLAIRHEISCLTLSMTILTILLFFYINLFIYNSYSGAYSGVIYGGTFPL